MRARFVVDAYPVSRSLITVDVLLALIIAVIQYDRNLTGVESSTQKVVLGLVILGAVLAIY